MVDPGGGQAAPGARAGGGARAGPQPGADQLRCPGNRKPPGSLNFPNRRKCGACAGMPEDPDLVPTMMADLAALGAAGISPIAAGAGERHLPGEPPGPVDPENLEATWRLNLSFPLLAAQAVAPRLADGGCLQLLLDIAIHQPFCKRLPYSAAKAGLAALVPGPGPASWRPGCGWWATPWARCCPGRGATRPGSPPAACCKRVGTPEDLARALRFAADSPYLTGEILTLDGGTRWSD